jgi:hypothetical protein
MLASDLLEVNMDVFAGKLNLPKNQIDALVKEAQVLLGNS